MVSAAVADLRKVESPLRFGLLSLVHFFGYYFDKITLNEFQWICNLAIWNNWQPLYPFKSRMKDNWRFGPILIDNFFKL